MAVVAAAGGCVALARASVVRVAGPSMRPALQPGDLLVTLPARLGLRPVQVGDVVVAIDPAGREVVKRLTALPGEWADVMDGPLRVPLGHVAVRGDDAGTSTDSRHYGPLPESSVRATGVMALSRRRPFVRIIHRHNVQTAAGPADVAKT